MGMLSNWLARLIVAQVVTTWGFESQWAHKIKYPSGQMAKPSDLGSEVLRVRLSVGVRKENERKQNENTKRI